MFIDELKQIKPVPGVAPKIPSCRRSPGLRETNPTPYLLLEDFRYGDPTGTDLIGRTSKR